MMTISKDALIKLLGDRPIAYHPMLARALGGVIEAVFASQLLYWYDRGKLEDHWIWKTQAEWTEETGLTRPNQETARRNLKKLGVLREKRKGVPGKMHFQLDLDRLVDLLTMLDSHIVETPQSTMQEPDIVQCEDSAMYNAETPQCIPESTTEITKDDNRKGGETPAPDYIDHVLEHAQKPDRAGIADPSQDIAAYMEYANEFTKAYHDIAGSHAAKSQKPKIEKLAEKGSGLEFWREVLDAWVGAGWNPRNIDGMIDCYLRGEIPTTGGKPNGKNKRDNSRGGISGNRQRPAYSVADPGQFESARARAEDDS